MKEIVEFLVKQFVPAENFEITVMEDTNTVDYKVYVDKPYIARLIGRNGKTSKAIRTIVKAASHNSDKSYAVFIEDR